MPDTLNLPRWSMVGEMNNRHMEAMPDGHYFDAVEVLAHIDALTAAVAEFVAFLNTYDEDGHPHASGEAKERAVALLQGEPHDA